VSNITVKAKIVKRNNSAKRPTTPRVGAWSLVVKHKGHLREAIVAHTHYSPSGNGMQPVRAIVWVHPVDGGGWISGSGSAGGCGYHKESQAIADAIDSCGIELYGHTYSREDSPPDFKRRVHFGGTGDSSYQAIFDAIARAVGYRVPAGSSLLVRS
jgi:flavin-binding protein dodecin